MHMPYQNIFYKVKVERYLVPILLNKIGLDIQLSRTLKGKVMNPLMFQVRFEISLQTRELLWGVTGELPGNYWVSKIICLSGMEQIVFELTLISFLNMFFPSL